MIKVKSSVKLNMPTIRKLTQTQATALEQTAEALHTEVVQAQVFPFDTGNLQNESTFVDYSKSARGKWYTDWLPGGVQADFAIRAYKEIYRRLTGI